MSEVKHTSGLTSGHILAIAEPYGAFEFGDAQGHKRLEFAADVIAARERLRDAAPDLLKACQQALYALKGREHDGFLRDAIAKATGATHD